MVQAWGMWIRPLLILGLVALHAHAQSGSVSSPAVWAPPPPAAPLADGSAQCLSDVTAMLQASCALDLNVTTRENVFRKLMSRTYMACVENATSSGNSSEASAVSAMVPVTYYAEYLRIAAEFEAQYGIEVHVIPVDATQLFLEAVFEHTNNLTTVHDCWVMDVYGSYQLSKIKATVDLTALRDEDAAGSNILQWKNDVLPGFQKMTSFYSVNTSSWERTSSQVYLPVDGSTPMLYYRTDMLNSYNLSVPRTWDEVLHVASVIDGKDMDGDGDGGDDYSFCLQPDEGCRYAWSLGMVMAPYIQYQGTAEGFFLTAEDQRPLFDNAGADAALAMFSQLLSYSAPLATPNDGDCDSDGHTMFMKGNCAMTLGWGSLLKTIEMSQADSTGAAGQRVYARGKYGVAPLPGSTRVYDRTLGELVDCTDQLCRYGAGGEVELLVPQARMDEGSQGQEQHEAAPPPAASNTTDSSGPSSASGASNATVAPPVLTINRAPFVPVMGPVGLLSGLTSPERQRRAFSFLSFVSSRNLNLALNGSSPTMPFRSSTLDTARLPDFVAAGFSAGPITDYFRIVNETIHHPNVARGPDIPRVEAIRSLLAGAATNVSLSNTTAGRRAVLLYVQQEVDMQVVYYAPTAAWRRQLTESYWGFLEYTPQPQNGTGLGDNHVPAVSLAVPIASAVVVLVLSTLYEFNKHRKHRSLFGKVVAPGPYEDTTLLVTDIQDSTALWEMLPSIVMDKAIKEHHQCIRKLLLKHSGYESATEGDSFLLAFHCPEDALLFAMEAQVALLECQWPLELLDCDVCRPYYVVRNEQENRVAGLMADNADGSSGVGLMALPRTMSMSALSNKSTSEEINSLQGTNTMLGAAAAGPGVDVTTFVAVCQASWKEATPITPNNVLIFRGLRVRMGMHTGIHNEADVAYNKAAARMQYGGEILQYGKSVSDAAAGGMILLSDATYKRLPMERLWDKALVMHVGEYRLKDSMPVLPLYQVTGRRLMGRLGYLSAMRFQDQLSMGALSAPLGTVAVASMGFVGMAALLSWNEALGREALALVQSVIAEKLRKWNGYTAHTSDDQILAVFPNSSDGLAWALSAHQGLLEAPWPAELLEHELCEELVVGETVVFRGVRVKSGLEFGQVVGEVNALTGRVGYRGKAITRATRIMASASSNQVLCSSEAWAAALQSNGPALTLQGVTAEKLGPFKLRGVMDKVDMVQIRITRRDAPDPWGAQDLTNPYVAAGLADITAAVTDAPDGPAGGAAGDDGLAPADGGMGLDAVPGDASENMLYASAAAARGGGLRAPSGAVLAMPGGGEATPATPRRGGGLGGLLRSVTGRGSSFTAFGAMMMGQKASAAAAGSATGATASPGGGNGSSRNNSRAFSTFLPRMSTAATATAGSAGSNTSLAAAGSQSSSQARSRTASFRIGGPSVLPEGGAAAPGVVAQHGSHSPAAIGGGMAVCPKPSVTLDIAMVARAAAAHAAAQQRREDAGGGGDGVAADGGMPLAGGTVTRRTASVLGLGQPAARRTEGPESPAPRAGVHAAPGAEGASSSRGAMDA